MTPKSGVSTGKVERREVGTCGTCGWWEPPMSVNVPYGRGICGLIKSAASLHGGTKAAEISLSAPSPFLRTHPEFGCTEWSEKE